eukprot:TRINITY_DN11564_c0_g1_i1.p1 TRINITY_DN11564_c0_g1~~TRINITY_DN11564_c0_g1_i1.p1  ORF type:complete len:132 (+),score=32.46 TRINITY_DN11564_c0_g1_i1:1-396(+)
MSFSLVVFACWRKIYGDLPLFHLLGPTNPKNPPGSGDPPPTYTKSLSLPSPLSLSDHLSPPPSYSRARELSESEDTFLPQEMFTMEDIKEMEVLEMEEEEQIPESSDNNQADVRCTDPINLLCVNCLHRLS